MEILNRFMHDLRVLHLEASNHIYDILIEALNFDIFYNQNKNISVLGYTNSN